jgi:hypothetical protein
MILTAPSVPACASPPIWRVDHQVGCGWRGAIGGAVDQAARAWGGMGGQRLQGRFSRATKFHDPDLVTAAGFPVELAS